MVKVFGEKLDWKHVAIFVLVITLVYFIYEHNGIKGAYHALLTDVNMKTKTVKKKHHHISEVWDSANMDIPQNIKSTESIRDISGKWLVNHTDKSIDATRIVIKKIDDKNFKLSFPDGEKDNAMKFWDSINLTNTWVKPPSGASPEREAPYNNRIKEKSNWKDSMNSSIEYDIYRKSDKFYILKIQNTVNDTPIVLFGTYHKEGRLKGQLQWYSKTGIPIGWFTAY